jgi:hypothetical protein
MPPAGFEPAISVLQRSKTVHTLDRATTVMDHVFPMIYLISLLSLTSKEAFTCVFEALEALKGIDPRVASRKLRAIWSVFLVYQEQMNTNRWW